MFVWMKRRSRKICTPRDTLIVYTKNKLSEIKDEQILLQWKKWYSLLIKIKHSNITTTLPFITFASIDEVIRHSHIVAQWGRAAIFPGVGITWSVFVSRNMWATASSILFEFLWMLNRLCIMHKSAYWKTMNQFHSLPLIPRIHQDRVHTPDECFVHVSQNSWIFRMWCYQFQFTRWKWNFFISYFCSIRSLLFCDKQKKRMCAQHC